MIHRYLKITSIVIILTYHLKKNYNKKITKERRKKSELIRHPLKEKRKFTFRDNSTNLSIRFSNNAYHHSDKIFFTFVSSYPPLRCPCACRTREFGPWRFAAVSHGESWNSSPTLFFCWPYCRQAENPEENSKLLHGV